MSTKDSPDLSNAIAIVGLVGRFPGARNLQELWKNLCDGKETISFFTEEEMLRAGISPATIADPDYVPARGVYERPLHFDARFFGYTPREAEILDPQQRIFLECCWEALEMAGYAPTEYPGRIGVFAGAGTTYHLFRLMFHPLYRSTPTVSVMAANEKDYLCTRVGYKLNLRGPCVTVQTACSTSLVATVLGCRSLLSHQADMVISGGVSVFPDEVEGYRYNEGSLLSPDGHCRSFDAAAKGTVFSSGVGVFVLKRFDDAVADNDTVYAVIRGFALTNDAGTRAYFTAAGAEGQAAVIQEAISVSGVDPETISYAECHGTGTVVGDPIEIKALTKAFRHFTAKKQYCAIGSIKSNIGHTDTAAGAAGLAKTVLALRNRLLPASLNYRRANPSIRFEETPFFVNTALKEWKSEGPLRAGVSSFGMGGTNAHVILEEAPPQPPTSPSRARQLLIWSARTPTALEAMTEQLTTFLQQDAQLSLADLAFTLQVGRRSFEHRRWLVCESRDDAISALSASRYTGGLVIRQRSQPPPVAFLFPGQGSQHLNMARELYTGEHTFKSVLNECAELFREHLGEDIRDVVYPEASCAEAATERIRQTLYAQPALFSIEYALARLWEEWGVRPDAMLGHSIGEYVAACLAGVFSLEDAVALVSARSLLMQQMPAGSMLSVFSSESELLPLLNEGTGLSLAAVNGSNTCVVAGPAENIHSFISLLEGRKIQCRLINTSHAFHSAMMEPMLEGFVARVRKVKLNEPSLPYISNVTGGWITAAEATDPEYWARQIRQPVRFKDGLQEMLRGGHRLFLEVGPGKALTTLVTQELGGDSDASAITSLSHVKSRAESDLESMLGALGLLWGRGVKPNWKGFHAREIRRRVAAPTYPFEGEEYGISRNLFAKLWQKTQTAKQSESAERRTPDEWLYGVNWARTAPASGAALDDGPWLFFLNSTATADKLCELLAKRNLKLIKVFPGSRFASREAGDFTVRVGAEEDYRALMETLAGRDITPTQIIHAFAVSDHPRPCTSTSCDEQLDVHFYSPLFLIKNLARHPAHKPLTLNFLCSEAFEVVGNEETSPFPAMMLGPSNVAPAELSHVQTRLIDLGRCGRARESETFEALAGELFSPVQTDKVVAFRGGHRWVRRIDSVPTPQGESGHLPRAGGVYLITGGLRGIGLAIAQFLAREFKARLILTSPTPLPDRESWTDYLRRAADDDPTAGEIRAVITLEEAGAEVLVLRADVADLDEMKKAVLIGRDHFGGIDGVVHAAEAAGAGPVMSKEREVAEAVLRPKVKGCLVLSELLEGERLDFFVLCSSITALVGAGQVDDAAANAFLDAFAWSRRRALNNRPLSVNWDLWDEVEAPASVAGQSANETQDTQGQRNLPAEGAGVFRRVISESSSPQVIVSFTEPAEWATRAAARDHARSHDEARQLPPAAGRAYTRPELRTPFVAPRSEIEEAIAQIWQSVLGLEKVGVHDDFIELGGHSLLAIQLTSRVRETFAIEFALKDFYQKPTIEGLSTLLLEKLTEQLGDDAVDELFESK